MLFYYGHDSFELFARHHRARRIVRVSDDNCLRFRRDRLFYTFGRKYKLVFGGTFHRNGSAARKRNARGIRNVGRLRHENFVPEVAHRAQGKVDCFARPDRHNRALGRIANVEPFF